MTDILRGFVSIAEGQVHYRSAAWQPPTEISTYRGATSGNPPLWMIHASPSSSWELSGLMRHLSDSRSCIAPDTLGNGDSAPAAPTVPDMAYYADSSLRVMDALGVERVDLYGSHTGAHIAVEMAIARPDRIRRVILDGIGMFNEETKVEYLARYAPAVSPDPFGSQFLWALQFVRDQGWFFPYFKRDVSHLRDVNPAPADSLHATVVEVLKAIKTYHHAYRAAFSHRDRERLPLVTLPSLVMADDTDPLKAGVQEAASLIPHARAVIVEAAAAADGLSRKSGLINEFLDSPDL
jgi:pimeloyl-ACP methyl ester carboxylesterase